MGEEIELLTQTCIKCYYTKEDKENYSVYALIRSYKPEEDDWGYRSLDSLLEASAEIEDLEEYKKTLRESYETVEEISLEEYMREVIETSKELNRWGY